MELGMPGVQEYVNSKQKEFFKTLTKERNGVQDDLFQFAFQFANDNNIIMYSSIVKLLKNQNDILQEGLLCKLRRKLETSESSKDIIYIDLNPNTKCSLPEYMRVGDSSTRIVPTT